MAYAPDRLRIGVRLVALAARWRWPRGRCSTSTTRARCASRSARRWTTRWPPCGRRRSLAGVLGVVLALAERGVRRNEGVHRTTRRATAAVPFWPPSAWWLVGVARRDGSRTRSIPSGRRSPAVSTRRWRARASRTSTPTSGRTTGAWRSTSSRSIRWPEWARETSSASTRRGATSRSTRATPTTCSCAHWARAASWARRCSVSFFLTLFVAGRCCAGGSRAGPHSFWPRRWGWSRTSRFT